MTAEKPDTRILEKIKKLLAFASDTRGNPNEVAAAARQVEAMLRKYNLEMSDVIMAELDANSDAVDSATFFLRYRKRSKAYDKLPNWANWIAVRTSALFDCHVSLAKAYSPEGRWEAAFRFFGYRTDLVICTWMMDYFLAEIFRASKKHPEIVGRKAHDSFREAAAIVLCARLKEVIDERERAERGPVGTPGTALVVRKRAAIEEKFGDFQYGKPSKSRRDHDYDAYAKGMEAGRQISINPGKPLEGPQTDTPRLN